MTISEEFLKSKLTDAFDASYVVCVNINYLDNNITLNYNQGFYDVM